MTSKQAFVRLGVTPEPRIVAGPPLWLKMTMISIVAILALSGVAGLIYALGPVRAIGVVVAMAVGLGGLFWAVAMHSGEQASSIRRRESL